MPSDGFNVPAGTVVVETAVNMEGLDRDFRELRKRGEKAGEDVGRSFQEGVGKGAGEAAKRTKDLKRGIRGVQKETEKSEESLGEWSDTADDAAKAGSGLALIAGTRLVSGLRGLLGWVGRTASGFLAFSGTAIKQTGEGLRGLGKELREQGGAWRAVGIAVQGTGTALETTGDIMTRVASTITGLQIAAAAAAGALLLLSKRAADDFMSSWNRVLTLIPEGVEGLDELKREVSSLAGELGVTADVANNTFYQVLSAMPQLVDRPTEALHVLRAALKATSSGFAEGETAAKAITGVLNAFQLEASEAERVADRLFAAQNQGRVNFQQMATEIGKVSDLTKVMGGRFDTLLGIIATLTPTGQSASEILTQYRAVLRSMLKPTDELNEALGGSATGFVKDRGLLAALQRIIEVTEGNPEVIARMFPRGEAQALLVSLSTKMGDLQTRIDGVATSAGTMDRIVKETNDDLESQKDLLTGDLSDALRQYGFDWERTGTSIAREINRITNLLPELSRGLSEAADFIPGGEFLSGRFGRPSGFERRLQALVDFGPTINLRQLLFGDGDGGGGDRPSLPVGFDLHLPSDEAQEFVDEAQRALDRLRPIDRPDLPVNLKFAEDRIAQLEATREVQAFTELLRTGDVEAFRTAMRAARLEVNDFIRSEVRRLRQLGVENEELRKLIQKYDLQAEKLKNIRVEHEKIEGVDVSEGFAPLERPGLVGAGASGAEIENLQRLRDFIRELNTAEMDQMEIADALHQKMEELGITWDDLGGILKALIGELGLTAEMLSLMGDNADDNEEDVRDLADEVQNLAQLAGGIFQLADAFGVFGDEASQALQQGVSAATQLAQGIGSLQAALAKGASGFALAGPIGAIAGGAAGIIGAVAGMFAPSAEEQRTRERLQQEAIELANALEELKNSAEAVRSVFAELPGGLIADFQKALERAGLEDASGIFRVVDAVQNVNRLLDAMEALGLTIADVEAVAAATGMNFDALIAAMRGAHVNADDLIQDMEAFQQAIKELQLERAVESFAGKMDMLQRSIEMFDIEDPVEKLERMRELFLEFAGLPAGMESEMAGLDLSTAEGRARFEEMLQAIFERIASGDLPPSALGKMSLPEFLDLIGQMESTIDEAAKTLGGETTSFQQVNTIREVTANRMVGTLTTIAFLERRQLGVQQGILAALGGTALEPPAVSAPAPAGGGAGLTITGDFIFEAPTLPGGATVQKAEEIGRSQARGFMEEIGDLRLDFEQSQGRVQTRDDRRLE